MKDDKVRVLRIIEYVGPREAIEQQLQRSLHGQRSFPHRLGEVTIRAATIGEFPEILERLAARMQCGQTAINCDTECEGVCLLPHGHAGAHDFGF